MPCISVIVPIYNSEAELPRCLNSIVSQTFGNLEIICVDDGSTDNSGKIIEEYAKKDRRIIAFHQENSGGSKARNVALKWATGNYVTFVDSDDWIEPDMYQTLFAEALEHDLDIVAASWYRSTVDQDVAIRNRKEITQDIFSREQFLRYTYMRDSYRGFGYMWNKLYKTKILQSGYGERILFDEQLKVGEDVLFLAQVALRVKKAKYIDRPFYHYYQRENSACHTTDLKKMRDWVRAYEIVLEILCEENIPEDIIGYVKRFMAYHSSNAVEMAIEQRETSWVEYFHNIMRKYEKDYMELNMEYPKRIERYKRLLEI